MGTSSYVWEAVYIYTVPKDRDTNYILSPDLRIWIGLKPFWGLGRINFSLLLLTNLLLTWLTAWIRCNASKSFPFPVAPLYLCGPKQELVERTRRWQHTLQGEKSILRQINFHVSIRNSDAVLLNTLEIAFSCCCGRKFNTGNIYYFHLHSISVNFLGIRAYCFYCAVIPEIQIAQNSSNHPREHLSGFSFTPWLAMMAQSPRWPSFFHARPFRGPPSLSGGKSEAQRGNEYLPGVRISNAKHRGWSSLTGSWRAVRTGWTPDHSSGFPTGLPSALNTNLK